MSAVAVAMRRCRAALGRLTPAAILAIGLGLFLVYGFPGLMTIDSFEQLAEARAGVYSDGHPPAMAALWRKVDLVIAGPPGMLVIQGVTFLIGCYLILRRAMRPRRAALAAVLVLLAPPILTTMVVVWKDCLMAAFLLLGVGLMLDDRRAWRLVGLGAIGVATAMRVNAPAATLPLVGLLFVWLPPGTGPGRWRAALARYGLAVAAWVAVTLAAMGVNAALTDPDRRSSLWHTALATMDIVGTLRHVDETIPDDQLHQLLDGIPLVVTHDLHQAARAGYQPWNYRQLVVAGREQIFALQPELMPPLATRAAIERAWKSVIADHPGAYLKHRWWTFQEVIGATRNYPWGSAIRHRDQDPPGLTRAGIGSRSSALQDRLHKHAVWLVMHTQLMRPYPYLLLALALLILSLRHRDVLALLLGGLSMEASLFFTAPTPDLRYSHWMMLCALLAAVILFARRYAAGRAAPGSRVPVTSLPPAGAPGSGAVP